MSMESRAVYYGKGNTGSNVISLILQMHKCITDGHIFWYVYLQKKKKRKKIQHQMVFHHHVFIIIHVMMLQGLNPGFLHCRQILYHLRHQGSSKMYPRLSDLVDQQFYLGPSFILSFHFAILSSSFISRWVQ